MSSLLETQREMARLVMQPMTAQEELRKGSRAAADALIKANDRLAGYERLQIYSVSYWARVLDCLADDFPSVRAVMGPKRFRRMSEAYLAECPSRSFTLRNLGARLAEWLRAHPDWMAGKDRLVLDTIALEWAQIEAFDAAQLPSITPEQLAQAAGEGLTLQLQPYISLLHVQHPVDDLVIAVKNKKRTGKMIAAMLSAPPSDIYIAVHRQDYSVHFKQLEPEAFRVLSLLQNGSNLASAIEIAFENSNRPEEEQARNVQEWFRLWQSLGWFCSRQSNPPAHPTEHDDLS